MEVLVVLAIVAIILYIAVPSMSEFMERRRIISAAEQIYSDLQYARSETIARSRPVHVSVHVDGTDDSIWAIGVSTTAGCDPTITDVTDASACVLVVDDGDGNVHGEFDAGGAVITDTDDLMLHVTRSTDFPDVRITGNSIPGSNLEFDPMRGITDENGTLTLQYTRQGFGGGAVYEMRVIVARIGRVRICTPPTDEGGTVTGYTICT